MQRIVTSMLRAEADIVSVRQRARRLAELLGFERQDQTRIATAVSEIARNAFSYAGGGRVDFHLAEQEGRQMLRIDIVDQGKGIADLQSVLDGRYRSSSGMGLGITGARRLMDSFDIRSDSSGTTVELGQKLPARSRRLIASDLTRIADTLLREANESPLDAVREQNRELMQSLDDLSRRQSEAEQLNREIEDTNRGVVALYAELDARAEQLRQASEIKSRFLSNMSHEFRTPLNSIIALTRLLDDDRHGALNGEQQRQVGYIRKAANDLLDLVNDLLDLAKVEAGKIEVKPIRFTIEELFSALRGALRPLREGDKEVELVFEPAADLPVVFTDEGKVAQVLRNFISNALKFTVRGEVRVSAHHDSSSSRIVFMVSDTGIGIAPEDQERIFEEFSQVDGHLQRSAKGTGLGLPLSRQLATLLGGEIWLESEVGVGSRFFLSIPAQFAGEVAKPSKLEAALHGLRVLVIDDDETFRYVLRQIVSDQLRHQVFEAHDGEEGLRRIQELKPQVVLLDLQMPRLDGFGVLSALRADPDTRELPVIVFTSMNLDSEVTSRLPPGTTIAQKDAISRDQVALLFQQVLH